MIVSIDLKNTKYNIYIERGIIKNVKDLIDLKGGRALIVTDDGVPRNYPESVSASLGGAHVFTVPQGESNKNLDSFRSVCEELLRLGFTRNDAVVAVGGGVIGDMAGFAASCYMRGIRFYNIPTTLLSQVDSSVGGKTAVDLNGIKNLIGSFYQPKSVIIDPETLSTLPERHISNGLAESIKMGVVLDRELFELCSSPNHISNIDKIIERSILAKASVVEKDEKESGLRKVLNFGHTIGHGIEASAGLGKLLHGECVALGMLPMCSAEIRDRVSSCLENCSLPVNYDYDKNAVFEALKHDKKTRGATVTLVKSDSIGSFRFEEVPVESLRMYL